MPSTVAPGGLRRHTVRGGAITATAQGVKFLLMLVSTITLARLLTPSDYGLVAMVTAFTGVVEILKDGGLSLATVQRERITDGQVTTLFWLNVALGLALTLFTVALTPLVIRFYNEPRLGPLMLALGGTFVVGGLGVQHLALLRRELRFTLLAGIEIGSVLAGVVTAIVVAVLGGACWALVGLTVAMVSTSTLAAWIAQPWRPGRAASIAEVRPLLGFGGDIIVTRLVNQFVRGVPNALLGWMWGPSVTGLYQRAYSLLMVAIDQIQSPVASVILPPLARTQSDSVRVRTGFLQSYRVIVSLILPLVATGAVFAEEFIALMLGARWAETAPIFRWLALGGVLLGILSPQGLLLLALGHTRKVAKITAIDAASIVVGYFAGLRYGAIGVAGGFLGAKLVLVVPLTLLSFRHTPVSARDAIATLRSPLAAVAGAAASGVVLKIALLPLLPGTWLAVIGGGAMVLIYAALMLSRASEREFYRGLIADLRTQRSTALFP